jgi:hypothetical protein
LAINPAQRPSAKQLLNHNFIVNFSKGTKYINNLIKRHMKDVEKYRLDSLKKEDIDFGIYNTKEKNSINKENNKFYINESKSYTIDKSQVIKNDNQLLQKNQNYKEKLNNNSINISNNNFNINDYKRYKNKEKIKIENSLILTNNSACCNKEEDNAIQKYDTLIINESEQKDKEKKLNEKKKIDYVYFMENDKFIYDDVKSLELIIKESIKNEEKKEQKEEKINKKKKKGKKKLVENGEEEKKSKEIKPIEETGTISETIANKEEVKPIEDSAPTNNE